MPSWQNPKSAEERLLSKYLGSMQWNTILDLGCGRGSLFELLKSKGCLEGKKEVGIDFNPEKAKAAREKGFNCLQGDACNLKSVKDNSIDFVVSSQVLEHVQDDMKMIREIARVLRPEGTALVSTVFKKPGAWYFYKCNGKRVLDPTHVREYTNEAQFLKALSKNGLVVLENKKERTQMSLASLFRQLAFIRFPVPNYFVWIIVCRKKK